MDKLEKPKFFNTNSFVNIIGIIGFIISIIQFLVPEKILSIRYKIYIFIAIFVFCLIIYFIQYIVNWHKFYKNYIFFYKKFEQLETRYDTRMNEIKQNESTINEYERFIETLSFFITSALTENSEKETRQLQNLQNLLYCSIEHFNATKGVDNNGRNL